MRISSLTTQTRLPSAPTPWGRREYAQVLIYGWLIACPLLFGGVDLWARALQWICVGLALIYMVYVDPASLRAFRGVTWLALLFLAWSFLAVLPLPIGLLESVLPMRLEGLRHTINSGDSQAPIAYEPWRTVQMFLSVLSWFAAAMFFAHWARHHQGRKRLIWMILVSGAGVILVAWLNHLTPGHIYTRKIETPGFMGPFTGRNTFADYLALSSLVGIGYLFQRWWPLRGSSHKSNFTLLALLFVVCAVAMMLASASRGACVAWVGGLVVFGAILWVVDEGRQRSLALFIGLFVVAALTVIYAHTLMERFEHGGLKQAAGGREVTWKQTVKMGTEHWWSGVGLGNFPAVFPRYQPANKAELYTHPENEYLEWWSETGFVGSLLLGVMIIAIARRMLVKHKWKDLEWQAGAIAALAALLIHSVVDFPLHIPANAFLAAAILGLAWGNVMRNPDEALGRNTAGRALAAAAGILLLTVGTAALLAEWQASHGRLAKARAWWPLQPRYFDPEIESHLARSEWIAAHRLVQRGLELSPSDWRLYYLDGWALAPLTRKTDESRAAFQRAIYWGPSKAETARKAGLFFWPRRPDISISFWNQSLENEHEQSRAYYIFLQRTSGIPGQLEMARVLAGKDVDRLMVLGDWMAESGSREKLFEIVQSVLAAPPPDTASREKLVYLLLKLERWKEAQALLDQTAKKSPLLRFYQAELYRYQKKWADALAIYHGLADQAAVKIPKQANLSLETLARRVEAEPANREVHAAYAWKLAKAGKLQEAEKAWAKVNEKWPEDKRAFAQRADCLEHLGRLEEAALAWKMYLSGHFENP